MSYELLVVSIRKLCSLGQRAIQSQRKSSRGVSLVCVFLFFHIFVWNCVKISFLVCNKFIEHYLVIEFHFVLIVVVSYKFLKIYHGLFLFILFTFVLFFFMTHIQNLKNLKKSGRDMNNGSPPSHQFERNFIYEWIINKLFIRESIIPKV